MEDRKRRGIGALNREFAGYDQVDKDKIYQLAEGEGGVDRFDEDFEIQTCDLRELFEGGEEGSVRFADRLGRAMADIGFVILEGHGVDPALYEEASRRIVDIFEGSSLEEKMSYRAQRHGSVNQGYFPIEETSDIHPDRVEGWVFCRRAFDLGGEPFDPDEFWPRPEQEPFFRSVCQAHERLILPIMQSILRYLGCDPHLYDEKLTATNFGLRLNYYPAFDEAAASSGAGRLLGHEDVDLFTFLPAPSIEGLQVLHRSGKWVRLKAPPGTIILNTGDYLQRISNDRLPSTTHRVSQPRDPASSQVPRVSFPMAVYVWEDEMLEVLPGLGQPKYEPIRAITFHTRTTSKFYGDDYAVEAE